MNFMNSTKFLFSCTCSFPLAPLILYTDFIQILFTKDFSTLQLEFFFFIFLVFSFFILTFATENVNEFTYF